MKKKIDWLRRLKCENGPIINVLCISGQNIRAVTVELKTGIKETYLVDEDTGEPLTYDPVGYAVYNMTEGHPLVDALDGVRESGALWASKADYNLMYTTALLNLGWTPPVEK